MVDLYPKTCNICGGEVEYLTIEQAYGPRARIRFQYDTSGFCYRCTKCGAIVGTHKDRPLEALGLLADKEMAQLRQKAHKMFDKFWFGKGNDKRTECYEQLAKDMGIPCEECHFAYFTKEQLEQAYSILCKWFMEKYNL